MVQGGATVRLPAQRTSFVGRAAELDALTGLLRSARLVTVAGAAGMGKTRLAIEAARRAPDDLDVHFVGLAALRDGGLVAHEIAARLDVPERPDQAVAAALAAHLDERPALLLLDNCEHLVADCATLVEGLLRACPNLRVLTTSLQPLRVPGEAIWRIGPLGDEAVALFEARARQVRPDFTVGPATAAAVAALCRRLEGVPLAIELAAAQMERLSVRDVLDRLDDRLHVLAADGADVPRHRTLHAALDWGHQLLDDRERRLFRRLAIFAGGFEIDVAEAVCAAPDLERDDVGELVFRLVERSLLQLEPRRAGADRYRLLEAVRQYAAERLAESGEGPAVAARHAAAYLVLARRAEREERGQDQTGWLQRLAADGDNLRAALDWCRGHDGDAWLTLAAALSWFWITRGHFAEGRRWLEGALEAGPESGAGRARAVLAAARVAFWQGDYPAARRLGEAALALFDESGDAGGQGWTLTLLGSIHGYSAEYDEGARCFEAAIAAGGGELVELEALVGLGEMLMQAGRLDQARAALEEVVRRAHGPEAPRGRAALFLGLAALFGGDTATAQEQVGWSLDIFQRLGNRYGAAAALDALAALAVGNSDPVRALRLSGAATALRDATRSRLAPRWRDLIQDVVVEPARRAAGNRADAAWAAGRALKFDEAVHYARTGLVAVAGAAGPAARVAPARPPAGLTVRELEVAELVASGMTNRQIAVHLGIAERTVEGHVERVRSKLGVRSRTQIGAAVARARAWPSGR
ncbi:MAG TPA: LuxR C-terminal-related transcriptional regulator [Candidatus Dormibacteraeota bacterium]|nr:LuxR C-terminal-related transcriptional regulator [Candidatus Dormibacteraeota bacterium]